MLSLILKYIKTHIKCIGSVTKFIKNANHHMKKCIHDFTSKGTTSTLGRRSVPPSSSPPSSLHRFFFSAVNTSGSSEHPNCLADSTALSYCFVPASCSEDFLCALIHAASFASVTWSETPEPCSWFESLESWLCAAPPTRGHPRNNCMMSKALVLSSLWYFSWPCYVSLVGTLFWSPWTQMWNQGKNCFWEAIFS